MRREVRLVRVEIVCKQMEKAHQRVEALRQADPKDWRGPYALGLVAMAQEQKEQALLAMGEATKLSTY